MPFDSKLPVDCGSDQVCTDQSDCVESTGWSQSGPGLSWSMQITQPRPSLLRSQETCGSLHHALTPHLRPDIPSLILLTSQHSAESIRIARKQSQVSNGFAGIKQDNALIRLG